METPYRSVSCVMYGALNLSVIYNAVICFKWHISIVGFRLDGLTELIYTQIC
jgi:hypothetical protein